MKYIHDLPTDILVDGIFEKGDTIEIELEVVDISDTDTGRITINGITFTVLHIENAISNFIAICENSKKL